MRPTGRADSGNLERSGLPESFGRGVEQLHDSVLIAEVQAPVGIGDRGRSGGALRTNIASPADFSGQELDADGESVVVAVAGINEIAHQDETAVMILKRLGVQEINFLRVDSVGGLDELEERGSSLIAGGGEHIIAADHRSGDIGDVVGYFVVAPEQLAVVGADTDEASSDKLHVLADARATRDHDGRISRAVAALPSKPRSPGAPQILAGVLIDGDYQRTEAAGREQELVSID